MRGRNGVRGVKALNTEMHLPLWLPLLVGGGTPHFKVQIVR
jgi:hypothetical protein